VTSPLAIAVISALREDPASCEELRALLRLEIPPTPREDGWLNSRQAAAYLAITVDALHKRTRRREIPATQETAGGKLYFRRADLDRWRLERSNGT